MSVSAEPSEPQTAKRHVDEAGDDTQSEPVVKVARLDEEDESSEEVKAAPEVPSISRLSEYEEMFRDRYTENDPDYMDRAEAKLEPVIMPNWDPPREFNRGGRGNWRGNGQQRYQGGGQRNWSQPQHNGHSSRSYGDHRRY